MNLRAVGHLEDRFEPDPKVAESPFFGFLRGANATDRVDIGFRKRSTVVDHGDFVLRDPKLDLALVHSAARASIFGVLQKFEYEVRTSGEDAFADGVQHVDRVFPKPRAARFFDLAKNLLHVRFWVRHFRLALSNSSAEHR